MSIYLHVEPNVPPKKWKDFIKTVPERSIALDGYVCEESKFDTITKKCNFNHHENVNRLATKATCAQVLLAIRLGMLKSFRDEKDTLDVHIYVNDCDEDVCLSYYVLKHSYLVENSINPVINKLVSIEELMDSTSGTYPMHKDCKVLSELSWIFEPYYRAKFNGLLGTRDSVIYENVIYDVERRINDYLIGKGETREIDTRYCVIGGGKNWSMVESIGVQARIGMFSDGISRFVTVKQRTKNTWDYVVGKTSIFVDKFDLQNVFNKLNELENCSNDKWGGSDIIGGSPRVKGSNINPKKLEKILNSMLEN